VDVQELVDRAEERLLKSRALDHWQTGRERIDAEDLITHVIGDGWKPSDEVSSANARRFWNLVERHFRGEPIPHILGYMEFRGLKLAARPGVFVPRESSEFLATQAIRRIVRRTHPVAVDVATGSGPVALAVAKAVRGAEVHGTDLSPTAVALARANARRLEIRAHFHQGDLFAPLPRRLGGAVDVITLHPPYVGKRELRELPLEVLRFEPVDSLTDHSPRGLGLIGRVALEAPVWLKPDGWVLIEVSPDRARAVATVLRRAGYSDVRSTKGGLAVTRVVTGRNDRRARPARQRS
jgi:release factor glutamine methyltransferase